MEKKSQIYKIMEQTLETIPLVLITIIYRYIHHWQERYHTTIDCRNGDYYNPVDIGRMTILENKLYVIDEKRGVILLYNLDTYKLIQILDKNRSYVSRDYLGDRLNEYISKYLKDNEDKLNLSNCSGYYSEDEQLLKNFWHGCDKYPYIYPKKYIRTYSEKYMFEFCNYDKYIINVCDKITEKLTYQINDNYENYKKDLMESIILAHDDTLYIIRRFMHEYDGLYYTSYYIRLYDTETFEFIREFARSPNKYPDHVRPNYIAVTNDKIIISMTGSNTNMIEIWIKDECL
jgi:hypothetical protein